MTVQVTFLGRTNYDGRTIVLSDLTNQERRDLLGFAYVQSSKSSNWAVMNAWPLPHRAGSNSGRAGDVAFSGVGILRNDGAARPAASGLARFAQEPAPIDSMTLGIPQPATTNAWKLALCFPVSDWTNFLTLRDRFADYCVAKSHLRLAHRSKPAAHKPVFVYGPEMVDDSSRNPAR